MPPHQAPNTKPVGPVLVKIHYREVELRDKAENGWRPMAMSKLFLPDFRFCGFWFFANALKWRILKSEDTDPGYIKRRLAPDEPRKRRGEPST